MHCLVKGQSSSYDPENVAEERKKIVVYSKLSEDFGWIRSMISKLALDVMVVHDGSEALFKCKSENPEFALLDVSMPKIGGIEVSRLLNKALVATKIILISKVNS